jgi:hypothetical protein
MAPERVGFFLLRWLPHLPESPLATCGQHHGPQTQYGVGSAKLTQK